MAQVLKKRRLVNPRRRRRMTPRQIRFFGTRRQKAGLRNRGFKHKLKRAYKRSGGMGSAETRYRVGRHLARIRRRNQGGIVTQAEHAAEAAIRSVERAAEDAIGEVTHQVNRRGNVGEILTVVPANPGRRRNRGRMARARTRNRRRVYRRRAHNRGRARNRARARARNYVRHRRRRNAPRVVVRYRNRARHHYRRNRRRNQFGGGNFLSGDAGKVVGVLGGATVTRVITNFLPSTLTQGWIGYLTTGVVATVTGQVVGRTMKNRQLGNWMTVGGLLLVGLDIINQFFPQLQLPFTTTSGSGMGLITSSNFWTPQVNMPGSMASFVAPAMLPAPVVVPATAMRGLGQGAQPILGLRTMRRVGRMR